jgi:hypothetical protein
VVCLFRTGVPPTAVLALCGGNHQGEFLLDLNTLETSPDNTRAPSPDWTKGNLTKPFAARQKTWQLLGNMTTPFPKTRKAESKSLAPARLPSALPRDFCAFRRYSGAAMLFGRCCALPLYQAMLALSIL